MATIPPEQYEDDVRCPRPYIPVGEFFSGRAVFVTGGTGFLGKVLVEKLLRSCPKVEVIYLLIRAKKGEDPQIRLTDLLKSPVFDVLQEENPGQLDKIVAVRGDVTEDGLGISPSDLAMIQETVSVVFHSAATVSFVEPLKRAVDINVLGTQRVLDLCKTLNNLEAMVHVSTCYSNCDLAVVHECREVVYPPPYQPEDIVRCCQWMDDHLLSTITPTLLGKRPNTYTFTKSLAENLMMEAGRYLPVCIVRPVAVSASWREPMVGWLDSPGGISWALASHSLGITRSLRCDSDQVVDLIPVDMCINLVICAAWKTAMNWNKEVTVYHSCSGNSNPVTFGQVGVALKEAVRNIPTKKAYYLPADNVYEKRYWPHRIKRWTFQLLPAYVTDIGAIVIGQAPGMVKTQKKMMSLDDQSVHFSTHTFYHKDDNAKLLMNSLNVEDRETFCFDVSKINWQRYLSDYTMGVRTFLVKDPPDTIPQARARMNRLRWLKRLFHGSVLIVGLGLLRSKL